jgi:nucleoside-diphosphate-sugar epimerase
LLLLGGGRQLLSFVCVTDVAEAVLKSIGCSASYGKAYHVAHPVPWSLRAFLAEIADAMELRPWRIVLPVPALYPVCLAGEIWSRVTGTASMVNLEKLRETTASGWVCTTARAAEDLGFVAHTPLPEGLRLTIDWYKANGWL